MMTQVLTAGVWNALRSQQKKKPRKQKTRNRDYNEKQIGFKKLFVKHGVGGGAESDISEVQGVLEGDLMKGRGGVGKGKKGKDCALQ